jgi:hypothetical protein
MPDISESPRHPFEVKINIGGDDWDYVLRAILELAYHLKDNGPEFSMMCSGGGGGSHHVTIARRDITPEAFHAELEAWSEAQQAEKE